MPNLHLLKIGKISCVQYIQHNQQKGIVKIFKHAVSWEHTLTADCNSSMQKANKVANNP